MRRCPCLVGPFNRWHSARLLKRREYKPMRRQNEQRRICSRQLQQHSRSRTQAVRGRLMSLIAVCKQTLREPLSCAILCLQTAGRAPHSSR